MGGEVSLFSNQPLVPTAASHGPFNTMRGHFGGGGTAATLGQENMETNITVCAPHHSDAMSFLTTVDMGRSPLMQFVIPATLAVCITVAWLAVANIRRLLRRDFLPPDERAVNCRMAISRYMIVFFAAVWLLQTTACVTFYVWNLTEGASGEAHKVMQRINTEPPFILAAIMAALVGVHNAVGIAFEVRKKRNTK